MGITQRIPMQVQETKPWQVPELNWVLRKSGSRERSTFRREDTA